VGISLTDPNMRRLLDVAWRKNRTKAAGHYIIWKLPKTKKSDALGRVLRILQEQDANSLGLNVIWAEEYEDIPRVLEEIFK
jgi:hypothetical protein